MNDSDLYAIAEILGHEKGCRSLLPEDDWMHEDCLKDSPDCSVWDTARLILSSDNLNNLLAQAWERGFRACQSRVGNDLCRLLPQMIDDTNPYVTALAPEEVG